MNEFITEIEKKFSTDVESVVMSAVKGLYTLDDLIEILYLYISCTDNSFIDREKFAETAHYIGLKAIFKKMHEIHFNYVRYKRQLEVEDKEGDEDSVNA